MKSNFQLLFILFVVFQAYTQDKRIVIEGKVMSNSGAIENVHIINKSSRKAVITTLNGAFQISVKESDTLIFSTLQFENKEIVINKLHLSKLQLVTTLKTSVNRLSEVTIHKSENMAVGLGLPNADKKPLNKLESRLNYHTKASLPMAIIQTLLLSKKGGFEDMFYIISGKREKDRKLTKFIEDDKYNVYALKEIQKIRVHFKDIFFIETLKIPKQEIDYFLRYCQAQNIIYLFNKNRTLEIIHIFIKESQPYLKKLENED